MHYIREREGGLRDVVVLKVEGPGPEFWETYLGLVYAGCEDKAGAFVLPKTVLPTLYAGVDRPLQATPSEDTTGYLDDAQSALSVLFTEVFQGAIPVLSGNDTDALALLLTLCKESFPVGSLAQRDCVFLRVKVAQARRTTKAEWGAWLNQTVVFREAATGTIDLSLKSCKTYGCALWRLLHLFADGRPGGSLVLSPFQVMEGIKLTVARYFSCKPCRDHFLAQYAQCDFGRCDVKEELIDQPFVSAWLRRVHTGVTNRVNAELQAAKA